MKTKTLLGLALLLLTLMTGCSSDDETQPVMSNDDALRGGVIYDMFGKPEVDTSDPLAVFFRDELHGSYWDGSGNEHKTFFEHGNWDDERCLMINSHQEFQDAYMGNAELPDVDFNKYTLIIGKTWGSDSSFELGAVILRDKNTNYELETKLYHHVEQMAFCTIMNIYYWRLYPKLPKKSIVLIRTTEDVN